MAIHITKYKTGVDLPPLTTSLNHLSGENSLTFPYKSGDSQDTFSSISGVHLLLVNGGNLILTDDTDTFSVSFGSSNITITWHSRTLSLADIDDVVFVFNAFAKPTSGITRLKYVATSGQTVFSGNDANGTALSIRDSSLQVFKNDNFLEDTDFTLDTTNNRVTLSAPNAASTGDIISIFIFSSVTDQTALNNSVTSASSSATSASNDKTTAQRWASNAVNTTVIDANTSVDSNEYSAKAYAIGDNQAGGSAKEWAIGGSGNVSNVVEGSNYSAKYYATQGNVAAVAAKLTEITNVSNNQTNIDAVSGNATNINAVAGVVSNNALQTVATNIAKVQTAADDLNETTSEIDTVAGAITNIDNVGNNIANVNLTGGSIANVNLTGGSIANVNLAGANISSINTTANNISAVTSVSNNMTALTSAFNVVNAFNNIYLGSQSSAPSQDPDGSALDAGDLYFDSNTNQLKVYGASGWQNAGSSVNGTSERFHYDITGTPNSVSGSDANGNTLTYDAGFADVYVNGIRMSPQDITITSGNSVVFASALTNLDEVDIVTFGTFSVTTLNASNLNSGTVPIARLGSGTKNNTTFLRGDNTFATIDLSTLSPIAGSSSIVTTGALNSGSISSGFGNIDNGTSTLTTGNSDINGTLNVQGETTLQTHLNMGDNDKIKLGASGDLEVYHDGNDSNIADVGTGTLLLKTDGTGIYLQKGSSETLAQFKTDAEVNLYHNNSKKFETTSTGVAVTGSSTLDDILLTTVALPGAGVPSIALRNTDNNIYHQSGSGNSIIFIDSSQNTMYNISSNTHIFNISNSERMRITSTGALCIGTSVPDGGSGDGELVVEFSSNSENAIKTRDIDSGNGGTHHQFLSGSSVVGTIKTTTSSTSYNTSSDHRLKENVTADWDATIRLKKLKPCRFNFISDETNTLVDGFLAHEAQAVVPECVTGTHNEVDADGKAVMQGIDQSKLVPLLVKTIQELEARITALEGA